MRRLLLAVLLALLIASTAAVAKGDDDEDDRQGRRHGARVDVGAFDAGAREAQGKYVSFRYNESGVFGYTAHGITLFDLTAERPSPASSLDIRADQAVVKLRARTFALAAHDNPTAVVRMDVGEGRAILTLVPQARVALDAVGARFTIGNLSGTIRGEDLEISGPNVTARDEILVFLDIARADVDRPHRADIGKAIVRRHVGAEANFELDDDEVREEVVSYGNVTMTTVKAGKGNLTIQIEGHGDEGRVLVFNVDGRVLGAAKAGDLTILLDNVSVAPAGDLRDALDPDDDGFTPESYVVFDPNAQSFQLILTVPHYSVHTLSVTVLELVKPSVVIGVIAGLVLLVPSAFVLFRRK